jgi:hypothetical protein
VEKQEKAKVGKGIVRKKQDQERQLTGKAKVTLAHCFALLTLLFLPPAFPAAKLL